MLQAQHVAYPYTSVDTDLNANSLLHFFPLQLILFLGCNCFCIFSWKRITPNSYHSQWYSCLYLWRRPKPETCNPCWIAESTLHHTSPLVQCITHQLDPFVIWESHIGQADPDTTNVSRNGALIIYYTPYIHLSAIADTNEGLTLLPVPQLYERWIASSQVQ